MARSSVKVQFNVKPFVQKAQRSFAKANDTLEQDIVGSIGSPIWQWPGQTERQSGQVVGSPRDIVDSGDLLDSYRVERRGPNQTAHVFDVPYALAVHEGAALRNGGIIPARPFTEAPVRDFPRMFAEAWRDER